MIPKFEWNITTKIILILILVLFLCWLLNTGIVEKFIDNDGLKCPDRLYYDGKKYYLFKVNDPIIKDVNPIIYNSYEEYLANKPDECKQLNLTKPFTRKLSIKDTEDKSLPYEWDCQRETASYNAKEIDCVNKTYNIFTEDECKLFNEMPPKYYTNNQIERCKVRKTIENNPSLTNNNSYSKIEYAEEGLVRVGAD